MKTRIAIVGCGAVANAHLPAVRASDRGEVTVLVDRALERAREMAATHGIAKAIGDVREIGSDADAAIVALPHHLHAPISIALMQMGLHVLVEKPMAMTTAECDRMIATAEERGVTLAVGLASRQLAMAKYVKRLVDGGMLGAIRSFDVREGLVYDWPVASDFIFRRETGGGVLADTGAHVLDLLLWWLGDWKSFEYRDDSAGGVEAECELRLVLESGAEGIVRLSRIRELRNSWILRGEHGTVECVRRFDGTLRWNLAGIPHDLEGTFKKDGEPEAPLASFEQQLEGFLEAIESGTPPAQSGHEGRRSVALIEACHADRLPLRAAWEAFAQGQRVAD